MDGPPRPNTIGPITTDGNGMARFIDIPLMHADGIGWTRMVYARLAGHLVGIGDEHYLPKYGTPIPTSPLKVTLVKTAEVAGSVTVRA